MPDPLQDFLFKPLSDLGQTQSSGIGVRTMPVSQNVEDRRGQWTSLSDLLHMAGVYMRGEDESHGAPSTVFPSGPYSNDIDAATKNIQFQTTLDELGRRHDANVKMEAHWRSLERKYAGE